MPNKPHISDWDRLFSKNTPRRRGPIALFVSVSLVLVFMAVLLVGARFGVDQYGKVVEARALTSTPLWKEYYATQTAAARSRNATPTPAPTAPAGTTTVTAVANLRTEPRIAPETVLGQVAVGDTVAVLEKRDVADATWYRVRVISTSGALKPAAEGWISSTLLASAP